MSRPFSSDIAGTPVKISNQPALLCSLHISNTTAAALYLQLFSTKSSVTPGTTVPDWTVRVQANGDVSLGLDNPLSLGGDGLTAICTTTATGASGALAHISMTLK